MTLVYIWALIALFGALIFETLIIYPNIFHDVPRSLDTAIEFAAVSGPSDFFPPLGAFVLVTGAAATILGWPVTRSRYLIAGSVAALLVFDFVVSAAFLWGRNTIMFVEGPAVHSAAVLQATAREFLAFHRLRVAGMALASGLAFTGFLRLYAQRMRARAGRAPARAPVVGGAASS